MKTTLKIALGSIGLLSGLAQAQSSVTLYGVIDIGMNYVSNRAGGKVFALTDGPPQAGRWGLKGDEDLGGGIHAIFTLENGFTVKDGLLSQGGRMFGRQAFVGLTKADIGTVTFGRQYDPVVDYLAPPSSNGAYAGGYFGHLFDLDNTGNDFRVDNSIKFKSASYAGLSFSTIYGFSNQASGIKDNRVYGIGAGYQNASFSIGTAYEQLDNPGRNVDGALSSSADAVFVAARQRIFGVGSTFTWGGLWTGIEWTRAVVDGIVSGPIVANYFRLDSYEINSKYMISPAAYVGGGYVFSNARQQTAGTETSPKWHQFNLMVDYFLSKRTDIFAMAIYQMAAGDATFAFIYGNGATSIQSPGHARQFVTRVGIRHKF
jgi:general bacterial porin, GBP family